MKNHNNLAKVHRDYNIPSFATGKKLNRGTNKHLSNYYGSSCHPLFLPLYRSIMMCRSFLKHNENQLIGLFLRKFEKTQKNDYF